MHEQMIGELRVMDMTGVKPNYAAVGRKHNLDWRTVKKYHLGYEGKPKNRKKGSKLDKYREEIEEKLAIHRITRKGVYEFLLDKYGKSEIGTYSNFKVYVRKHKLSLDVNKVGKARYETEPGKMIQVDWKEDITLHTRNEEPITVQVFHMVLKYSKYSYLEVCLNKTQKDVFRCMVNGFRFFGGISDIALFDNMSTAANVTVRPKRVNEKMEQFSKDIGFEARLCKIRSGFTKGTVEARNKMVDWLRAYNGEFETFEELTAIVEKINQKMNLEVRQEDGVAPVLLYYKEKEYLKPLPCKQIMEAYLAPSKVKVSNESLVYYKGNKYSVDKKLISEYVELEEFSNKLFIYYNGKVHTVHEISNQSINYKEEHYKDLIAPSLKDEESIEKTVQSNLALMDRLFNKRSISITKEEATQSIEGFAAYLSCAKHGKWIVSEYTRLTKQKRNQFFEEMKKLLPYTKDEEQLFASFKHAFDKEHIEYLRLSIWLLDDEGTYSILSEEGHNLLCDEFQKEIIHEYQTRYLEMQQDNRIVDNFDLEVKENTNTWQSMNS